MRGARGWLAHVPRMAGGGGDVCRAEAEQGKEKGRMTGGPGLRKFYFFIFFPSFWAVTLCASLPMLFVPILSLSIIAFLCTQGKGHTVVSSTSGADPGFFVLYSLYIPSTAKRIISKKKSINKEEKPKTQLEFLTNLGVAFFYLNHLF